MSPITSIEFNIAEKLEKDKSYRSRFFRGQAQGLIAMRIRKLRKKRKKNQTDLAKECKMKQSAISRIEQADYSGWSFNTLFRVADALDARLQVSFDLAEDIIDLYRDKEADTKQCDQTKALTNELEDKGDSIEVGLKKALTTSTEGSFAHFNVEKNKVRFALDNATP